uniref:Uncharacterized protein n=1 Tax=Manihot esculenta TaxID=3983 RepID=A0A2C9WNF1_MANES
MEKPQSEEVVLFGTWASAHCTRVQLPTSLQPSPQEAKVRFWANFFDQKVGQFFQTRIFVQIIPSSYAIILSKGKEQENAIKEFNQLLSAFEEGIEKDFSTKFPSNGGNETLGFLEIVVVVDPKEHPAFFSWVAKLKECPLMNETLPPHNKLVAKMRERLFQAPKA